MSLAFLDVEVGIALCLLQDLANELREGNCDDGEEDKWLRSSGSSSVELWRHQQSKSESKGEAVEELNYTSDDDSDSAKWSLHSLRRLRHYLHLHLHSSPFLQRQLHSQVLGGPH